jgi:hydrogenase nickel incorporation protein HypA/HybF
MHELSLANQLVAVAEETARQAGAHRVTAVMLKVGLLSGVAVEALQFAYDVASAGTLLAGSRLETRIVPVSVYCPTCEREVELASIQSFCCAVCGTPTGDVRSGRELEIEGVEVE